MYKVNWHSDGNLWSPNEFFVCIAYNYLHIIWYNEKSTNKGFCYGFAIVWFPGKNDSLLKHGIPHKKKTRKLTGLPRFPAFLESPNWKKNGPSNEIPLFPTLFGPPVEALNSVRAVGDLNSMLQEAPVDRSRHGKKPTGEREGVSWRKKGRKHTP